MQAIPTNTLRIFERALELSKDHNTVFLANIAQELNTPKTFFAENAQEYDKLNDIMEMINTNLEANILRLAQGKFIDPNFARFALEAVHGWKADAPDRTVKIVVEGVSDDDLAKYLDEGNYEV